MLIGIFLRCLSLVLVLFSQLAESTRERDEAEMQIPTLKVIGVSVWLSVYLTVCLSVYLSVYLTVCLSDIYLFTRSSS